MNLARQNRETKAQCECILHIDTRRCVLSGTVSVHNQAMDTPLLIAGGGIGGLAAALALARQQIPSRVIEQADAWAEVGAGIQLGPNVVRVLKSWGLGEALQGMAAFPQMLRVRDALNGRLLGMLPFDSHFSLRYGAPYATVHRADLHRVLLQEVMRQYGVQPQLQRRMERFQTRSDGTLDVELAATGSDAVREQWQVPMLIGADGLWSRVRKQLLPGEAEPRYSGILAYRALVPQTSLPACFRTRQVTAWLGPDLHAVQYPVRGGSHLNLVIMIKGPRPDDLQGWDHAANAGHLRTALRHTALPVRGLADAVDDWRLWPLCDRPPVRSAREMAQGQVALLGDAAHPMRPFLAQGAGMAIEDAAVLAQCLQARGLQPQALQQYAQQRWQRVARVQQRSIRNGGIFHSSGWMRWGRDTGMRLLGERLIDVPWLYGQCVV